MARPELGERIGELVAGVALGVVAEHGLDGPAALRAHPLGAAPERDRDVGGVLGAVQLGVDQARVVVLHGDHDGVPEPAGAADLIALAGHTMPGGHELRRLVGVDMQKRARLAPLKALERLARAAPPTPDAVALEHLPHRRAMAADQRGQAHRPPVRPRAGIEDRLLIAGAQRPRTGMRHRPTRGTPRAAQALGVRRLLPTIPRARHRRRRTAHRTSNPDAPTPRPAPDRPSRAWHAVRTCTYRLSCVRPSRWALRWLAPLSLRRRPDTSLSQPPNPSNRSASSTASGGADALREP